MKSIIRDGELLKATRPTAVNLEWAVKRVINAIEKTKDSQEISKAALKEAMDIADEDADNCMRIGEHGVSLIEKISRRKNGETVNILTHCNADL